MAEQAVEQAIAQVVASLQAQMSELQDIMKGAYATSNKETATGQDVGHDEAIKHASAMIPLNSKFWFDQVALQAHATNALMIAQTAGYFEMALEKARGHESPCKGHSKAKD